MSHKQAMVGPKDCMPENSPRLTFENLIIKYLISPLFQGHNIWKVLQRKIKVQLWEGLQQPSSERKIQREPEKLLRQVLQRRLGLYKQCQTSLNKSRWATLNTCSSSIRNGLRNPQSKSKIHLYHSPWAISHHGFLSTASHRSKSQCPVLLHALAMCS